MKNRLGQIIRNNYGILASCGILLVLLSLRVNSLKYSLDTTHIIDLLQNIFYHHSFYSNIAGTHRFNIHFSPFLAILSPLVVLGPGMLIFLWKTVCYGMFLFLLWKLIDKEESLNVREKQIAVLLIAAHPTFFCGVIDPNIWDADLTLPFLALSILAFSRKKYFASMGWLSVTFTIKEDMPLVGVLFGVMLVLYTREIKYFSFSLLSMVAFWLITQAIMPSFAPNHGGLELMRQNYGHLGNSFGEIAMNVATNPFILFKSGFWMRKVTSICILFLCVGLLPLLRRVSLMFLIPGLVILLYGALSNEPFLDYSKHYMLVFYVFLIWSSLAAYSRIDSRKRLVAGSAAVLASMLVMGAQIYFRTWSFYLRPLDNSTALHAAVRDIPRDAFMLTNGVGSPWATYGRRSNILPDFDPGKILAARYDYVLVNKRTAFWEVLDETDSSLKDNLVKLGRNKDYRVIFDRDDVVLLKREQHQSAVTAPSWTADLGEFENINQVRMKPGIIRKLRRS